MIEIMTSSTHTLRDFTKRFRRAIRAPFEAIFGYCLVHAIPGMSRPAVVRLSRALGWIGYHVARGSRRVALANLDLAYGDRMSKAGKREICLKSFRSFALTALDLLWFSRDTLERMKAYVDTDPVAKVEEMKTDALVCVTGHMGNWEILGRVSAKEHPPLVVVAAPIKNHATNVLVGEARKKAGQEVVFKTGAIRALLKCLSAKGRVGLVMDQNVRVHDGGAYVRFFGYPVPLSMAAEKLALKTGAGVVCCVCRHVGEGRYRCYYWRLPDVPDREREGAITQAIAGEFERMVTENPGDWLWMYKRWRYIPIGFPGYGFPYYSERDPGKWGHQIAPEEGSLKVGLKKIRRGLRYPFEALAGLIAVAVIPRLSRPALLGLSRTLGAMAYHVSAKARRVAMANLDVAYGDELTMPAKRRMVKDAFRTFALTGLDLIWFSRSGKARIEQYVRLDRSMDQALKDGAWIAVTGHYGNWELLARILAMRYPPVSAIAAPVKNRIVNGVVTAARESAGLKIITRDGAVRGMLKALKQSGRILLLLDQNVRPRHGGMYVGFLGLPAPVSLVAEKLARHSGARVVFPVCRPVPDGTYECYCRSLPEVPSDGKDGAVTRTIAGILEEEVRRKPSHWLWMYHRWRYIPDNYAGNDYPFYSVRGSA